MLQSSMSQFCWHEVDADGRRACTEGAGEPGFNYAFCWYASGELADAWERGIRETLQNIRDGFGYQKSIYGTTKTADKMKYPELGLSLIIGGEKDDPAHAVPIVIIDCPRNNKTSSLKFGNKLRRVFEEHTNLISQGFEIKAHDQDDFELLTSIDAYESIPSNQILDSPPVSRSSSVNGKCIRTLYRQNFSTLGGVLRVGSDQYLVVTTAHSLASSCTFQKSSIYLSPPPSTSSRLRTNKDSPNLLASDCGSVVGSPVKQIAAYGSISSDYRSEDYYKDLSADWIAFSAVDERIPLEGNCFEFEKVPFRNPKPLTRNRIPSNRTVYFEGALSGCMTGQLIGTSFLVPVDGGQRSIMTWAIRCLSAPGDSGAWVVSTDSLVVGIVFARSPQRRLTYVLPGPTYFKSIYDKWKSPELLSLVSMFDFSQEKAPVMPTIGASQGVDSTPGDATSRASTRVPDPQVPVALRAGGSHLPVPDISALNSRLQRREEAQFTAGRSNFSDSSWLESSHPGSHSSTTTQNEQSIVRDIGMERWEQDFLRIEYQDWLSCFSMLRRLPDSPSQREQLERALDHLRKVAAEARQFSQSNLRRRSAERTAMLQMLLQDVSTGTKTLKTALQGADKPRPTEDEKKAIAELLKRTDEVDHDFEENEQTRS